jgi:hypothetical protein
MRGLTLPAKTAIYPIRLGCWKAKEVPMGRAWENPHYGKQRRLKLAIVPLLLVAVAASMFWLLRRTAPDGAAMPDVKLSPSRPRSVPTSVVTQPAKPIPETMDAVAVELPVAEDGPGRALDEARPDDFAARKLRALDLYRRNELKPALEQVQAALALQADGELLDLQKRLEKEIRVQRNYDDARTANFVVLFDGREHDEIKYTVLDILKSAYAEIGKELDYFPEQPISVILYTARDFSDVTSAPVWAGGLFGMLDGKIRLPVQGAAGHEQELRRVLYHEYTHALLYALAPSCPLWLQEGLAQYFSADKPVNAGQVIPLPLLANGFPNDPRAAFAAYMESLQAVVDLLEEHGMSRLHLLLEKLSGGSDMETAFATAYGQPFSLWVKGWRPLQREE